MTNFILISVSGSSKLRGMFRIIKAGMVFLLMWVGSQSVAQQISSEMPGKEKSSVFVGEKFDLQNVFSAAQMDEEYQKLKAGDTIKVSFRAEVASVCKNKGCWMKVTLEDGAEVMVKFKDYAFFVPRNIENNTAYIHGLAYVEEMSVEDQKHYAEDEGLSLEEISAIKEPKKSLLFMADGVKMEK